MTSGRQEQEPVFAISVAARMVGLHAQTLRSYERMGLVAPERSQGNKRLYSPRNIEQLRQIRSLMEDLGVNLAGVEVVLRMRERMARMEEVLRALEAELYRLRRQDGPALLTQGIEFNEEQKR